MMGVFFERVAARCFLRLPRWGALTLSVQFLMAGSVVLVIGMLAMGLWVSGKIADSVTRNSAAATALYMQSVVAPLVQELAQTDQVHPDTREKLDAILAGSELGRKIVSFKIWKEGGLVAYSTHPSIIGKRFPVTANLKGAWRGEVTAEFDDLNDEEDLLERRDGVPLLEMYSPIRERNSQRIIAVAEFYEIATDLKTTLFWSRLQSWAVVACVTLAMLAALFGIVVRGSRTIERQRRMLQVRVDALSALLAQNEELRARLQRATHRTAEINDQYLRRIGADLHDGPSQSLALALLRLDALEPLILDKETDDETSVLDVVREALRDAIAEVREICAGLTLPKLDELSVAQILEQAVVAHERRTRTEVALTVRGAPEILYKPLKICIFRFIQEALNNAFRHASGVDQRVTCAFDGGDIRIEVSDKGPGFVHTEGGSDSGRLGLLGLRERIESLGGSLEIVTTPGAGTRLIMRCHVDNEGRAHGQ